MSTPLPPIEPAGEPIPPNASPSGKVAPGDGPSYDELVTQNAKLKEFAQGVMEFTTQDADGNIGFDTKKIVAEQGFNPESLVPMDAAATPAATPTPAVTDRTPVPMAAAEPTPTDAATAQQIALLKSDPAAFIAKITADATEAGKLAAQKELAPAIREQTKQQTTTWLTNLRDKFPDFQAAETKISEFIANGRPVKNQEELEQAYLYVKGLEAVTQQPKGGGLAGTTQASIPDARTPEEKSYDDQQFAEMMGAGKSNNVGIQEASELITGGRMKPMTPER